METEDVDALGDVKAPRKRQWLRGVLWVGSVWLIGWSGICIEQAVGWTDTRYGLGVGVVVGGVFSFLLLILLIPLGLLGWAIGSARGLRRWQWWISLAFPLGAACWMIVPRVQDRLEPGRRFERFTKIGFPTQVQNLQTYFSGAGLLADVIDTYTFECPREETDRLISSLGLEKANDLESRIHGRPGTEFSPAANGWHRPERWIREQAPDGKRRDGTDFLEVLTDETHTHVHVIYGTI